MKAATAKSKRVHLSFGKKNAAEIIVFLLAFFLYSNTLFNGYNLDDNLVTQNHPLSSKGIKALPEIFKSPLYQDEMGYSYGYRPLSTTTFAIEHQFFGDNPAVSHFINVFLYSLLCLLLYRLLLKIILPGKPLVALAAVLLFAAHPMHTEVVASIKNRDEILALLFALSAVMVNHRFTQTRQLKFLFFAYLLFMLALLSKPSAISFFAILSLQLLLFSSVRYGALLLISFLLLIPVALLGMVNNVISFLYYLFGTVFFLTLLYICLRNVSVKAILINNSMRLKNVFAQLGNFFKNIFSRFVQLKSKINLLQKLGSLIKGFRKALSVFSLKRLLKLVAAKPVISEKLKTAFAIVIYLLIVSGGAAAILLNSFNLGIGLIIVAVVGPLYFGKLEFSAAFIPVYILTALHYFYYYPLGGSIIDFLYLFGSVFIFLSSNKMVRGVWVVVFLLVVVASMLMYDIYTFLALTPIVYFTLKYERSKIITAAWIIAIVLSIIELVTTPTYSEEYYLVTEATRILTLVSVLFIARKKTYAPRIAVVVLLFTIAGSAYHLYHYGYTPPRVTLPDKNEISCWVNKQVETTKSKTRERFNNLKIKTQKNVSDFGRNVTQKSKELISRKTDELKEGLQSTKNIPATVISNTNRALNTKIKTVVPFEADRPCYYVETPVTEFDPLSIRAGTSLVIILKYLKSLFIPYPQAFYYGYSEVKPVSITNLLPALSLLICLALFMAALWIIKIQKEIAFLILFYLITIAAVSTFTFRLPGMMADRYLLTPSIAFCALLAWFCFKILGKTPSFSATSLTTINPRLKYFLTLLLVTYSAITFTRNFNWKDPLTLMRHDIAVVEQSAQAHNILALALMKQTTEIQNTDSQQVTIRLQAVEHFKKALNIYPGFFNVAFDIGRIYTELNIPDSALLYYSSALQIDSTYITTYQYMVEILIANKKYEQAVPYAEFIIRNAPDEDDGYIKLAYIYFILQQYEKSIQVNKRAITETGNALTPLISIAQTFAIINKKDSALHYYRLAKQIEPNNTIVNQGISAITLAPQ